MDGSLYFLRNRAMPWGDCGDILLSGLTSRLDCENGLLQLERTGPFVPPITISGVDATGYEHLVVTNAFKSALDASGLSGLRFRPVVKRRIVYLEWHTWDHTAEEPPEYPESGEPENYILLRPHDHELAEQMGLLTQPGPPWPPNVD